MQFSNLFKVFRKIKINGGMYLNLHIEFLGKNKTFSVRNWNYNIGGYTLILVKPKLTFFLVYLDVGLK